MERPRWRGQDPNCPQGVRGRGLHTEGPRLLPGGFPPVGWRARAGCGLRWDVRSPAAALCPYGDLASRHMLGVPFGTRVPGHQSPGT